MSWLPVDAFSAIGGLIVKIIVDECPALVRPLPSCSDSNFEQGYPPLAISAAEPKRQRGAKYCEIFTYIVCPLNDLLMKLACVFFDEQPTGIFRFAIAVG